MNFDLAEEQKMLADQVRGLLAEQSSPDRLRHLVDTGAEWDESLWRTLSELGFLGARISEDYGGLGLGDLDLGVISEELGRAVAAVPFHASIVCAADAIQHFGSAEQKEAWLPKLASGEVVGTLAHAEGLSGWWPATSQVRFEKGALTGMKAPVGEGGVAGMAVVYCNYKSKSALALVDLTSDRVTRRKRAGFDHLRAQYALEFDQAPASLLEASVENEAGVRALIDRMSVQAAFEAIGGAESCVYMARDYAMDRQIFGRSLASYQAIKHKLADILVATEFARSNAFFAGWASDNSPEDLAVAAAAVRLSAVSAYEQAARENLQIHGGIGYTFEAECHFHYRRERTLAITLGPRQYWADRLISGISGTQTEAA
ncbi:acyl-CoA dehydrogenase family protein [uncultured Hyphomonas sp.]|uniref:acyl-CoA dehydrogenase family protein n=1 Tax=uncultured Hyphomonas sp. TaxID=225298 RepID=UPI0030D7BBF6|tara:strand:- start:39115 stop:40233 length:1119 start_codon:yes stop_codon:yes gene_type:complete